MEIVIESHIQTKSQSSYLMNLIAKGGRVGLLEKFQS